MGRIVISGGAGFIGSHLAERALSEGHTVVAVDNLVTGRRENIAHLMGETGFSFLEHDVCLPFEVDGDVDAVLHFASPASPVDFTRIPIPILKVGSLGAFTMLELAREKSARILVASTSEVYGDPLVHPQVEDYWGNVNPNGLRSCYDEAKRFTEAAVMAYHREYGLATRILRIFNTYGPRMRLDDGRAIVNFVTQALRGDPLTVHGDGSQTRSFCYVDDLVDGAWRLLWSEELRPVNVGNPREITIAEFARTILGVTGSQSALEHLPPMPDDPTRRRPNIERAKAVLGWEPTVELEEGLERTISDIRTRLGELSGAAGPELATEAP